MNETTPLRAPPRRGLGGVLGRLFKKEEGSGDPSAAHLLGSGGVDGSVQEPSPSKMKHSTRYIPSSNYPSPGGHGRGRTLESFHIAALHSSRSGREITKRAIAIDPTPGTPGIRKFERLKTVPAYSLVAASSSSLINSKGTPYQIAAIDAELQRMYKLQLGPLTIASDIEPVLELWRKLQAARAVHGRKSVASTWSDLARATAIVAKKMTIPEITEVLDAQWRLVYPCPRNLRLPADMLMALADRAGTMGALREATDDELLHYCASVGRLLDEVTQFTEMVSLAPVSSEHWLKALNRAAVLMPLVEAGLRETARRGKRAAVEVSRNGKKAERDPEDAVKHTLMLADALAELAGTRLAAPSRCVGAATALAEEEAGKAHAAAKALPWWKKVSGPPKKHRSHAAVFAKLEALPPSHTETGTQEASNLAGKAAEYLSKYLAPAAIPQMTPDQLTRFAGALKYSTADDAEAPSHEPLRQVMGLVVEEVVQRTNDDGKEIDRKCVKAVVGACRKRLLHVKFPLEALKEGGGLPASLAKLESYKVRTKKASRRRHPSPPLEEPPQLDPYPQPEPLPPPQPATSEEKEAVSLELHDSLKEATAASPEVTSAARPASAKKATPVRRGIWIP